MLLRNLSSKLRVMYHSPTFDPHFTITDLHLSQQHAKKCFGLSLIGVLVKKSLVAWALFILCPDTGLAVTYEGNASKLRSIRILSKNINCILKYLYTSLFEQACILFQEATSKYSSMELDILLNV